jgi:hypothetical protein
VRTFAAARDAKEFLVSRIITEAQREGVPLSETERKMLYFSETAWTLPDIAEVSDAFDRDYDQARYEEKIGSLIRNLRADSRKNNRSDYEAWTEAVRRIQREDHYLLALISASRSKNSPPVGFLKPVAIGFGLAGFICAVAYLFLRM